MKIITETRFCETREPVLESVTDQEVVEVPSGRDSIEPLSMLSDHEDIEITGVNGSRTPRIFPSTRIRHRRIRHHIPECPSTA